LCKNCTFDHRREETLGGDLTSAPERGRGISFSLPPRHAPPVARSVTLYIIDIENGQVINELCGDRQVRPGGRDRKPLSLLFPALQNGPPLARAGTRLCLGASLLYLRALGDGSKGCSRGRTEGVFAPPETSRRDLKTGPVLPFPSAPGQRTVYPFVRSTESCAYACGEVSWRLLRPGIFASFPSPPFPSTSSAAAPPLP
jgi:hypothetical protein